MSEHTAEGAALTRGIEPEQVGTRIEDGMGRRWVRIHPHGSRAPWWLIDADTNADPCAVWSAIPKPTRVLPPAKPCVECGQPAPGRSSYCHECHSDAFEGGADIG